MFDQTLLPEERESRRRLSVLASVVLQCATIALPLLFSVIYTQRLPMRQLQSMLLPPTPPYVAQHPPSSERHPSSAPQIRSLLPNLQPIRFSHQPAPQFAGEPAPNISSSSGVDNTGVMSDILGKPDATLHPPPAAKPEPAHPAAPVRVISAMAAANLVYKVVPPYPYLARTAGVQGAVEFTAVIGKDGVIRNLQLVRGHPLLVEAARQAVLQWRYRPTMLNGAPVEVATEITVNFRLGQ
jgi:periplasmic protein TonB